MPIYVAHAHLGAESALIYDFHSQALCSTQIPIEITFDYSMPKDFKEWHLQSSHHIKLLKITVLATKEILSKDKLSIETQIMIGRACSSFLEQNELLVNQTIIPLYQYPLNLGGPNQKKYDLSAKVIPFVKPLSKG